MPGIGVSNTPVAVATASTKDVRRLPLVGMDVDVGVELIIEFALTSDGCSMSCCCPAGGPVQQMRGRAKERAQCKVCLLLLPLPPPPRDFGSPVRGRLFT